MGDAVPPSGRLKMTTSNTKYFVLGELNVKSTLDQGPWEVAERGDFLCSLSIYVVLYRLGYLNISFASY